jgi:hypothetical protein
MDAQTQTLRRLRRPVFRQDRKHTRNLRQYGFREEEKLRCGLRSDKRLAVHHSAELDEIYKLDAVVRDLDAPHLPAVGVQFTTKHDTEKEDRTLDAVRRHRVVVRLLYLVAECPLRAQALPMIRDMVRHTARQPSKKALILAVLAVDEQGQFYFRRREELPLETKGIRKTQDKERTKTHEKKDTYIADGIDAHVGAGPVHKSGPGAQPQLQSGEGRHVHEPVRLRLAKGVRAEQVGSVSGWEAGDESGSPDRGNDRARVVGRRPDAQGGGKVWRIARAA